MTRSNRLTDVIVLARIAALALIATVLWEAFETMVLPQRTIRRIRLTRFFYLATWIPWRRIGRAFRSSRSRERFLALFGPLATIWLLIAWAVALIFGFAVIFWTMPGQFAATDSPFNFPECVYYSGSLLVTLGPNDASATTLAGRLLSIVEAGVGFGFLAVTITYLPVLYNAFSRREQNISLLDARAGSPPSALELLRHFGRNGSWSEMEHFLADWERWGAELLETHMSYPLLGFFRSQHHNQSWIASLVTMLDTCSWMLGAAEEAPERQAQLTFAICRHALVDLAQVFHITPEEHPPNRLSRDTWSTLQRQLRECGVPLRDDAESKQRVEALTHAYGPYIGPLAERFATDVPQWVPAKPVMHNWAASAWGPLPEEVNEVIQSVER